MKKMEFTETTTYKYNDNYFIDIVLIDKGGTYDQSAWIYHKDYGVKDLMFGITSPRKSEVLELAKSSVIKYIKIYRINHIEGENYE